MSLVSFSATFQLYHLRHRLLSCTNESYYVDGYGRTGDYMTGRHSVHYEYCYIYIVTYHFLTVNR